MPAGRSVTLSVTALAIGAMVFAGVPISTAWAVPSTTGTIAFVSEVNNDDEIAIMSADGARTQVLTDNAGPDRAPSWSADGSSLVFNSRRAPHPTRPQIYQLDPATQIATRLTDSAAEDQRASLSTSGGQLFLQRGVFSFLPGSSQPFNLIQRDLGSGVETALTADVVVAIWNAAPAPSPDGRWLLFQSNRDVPSPSGPFPQTLYALDLANGNTVTALPFGASLGAANSIDGPRWNADGTEFVYSSGGRLFVGSATGADPALWGSAPVTIGDEDSSPSFSPDGTSIVFQTYVEGADPDGADDVTLIRVLDRATGEINELGEGRTPVWTSREWLPGPASADNAQAELPATGSATLLSGAALGGALLLIGAVAGRRRGRREHLSS